MTTPSLLDLPPELRERIFIALLVDGAPTSLQHRFTEPEISKVCRLLRVESLGVFYYDSTFCIDNNGGHVQALQKLNSTLDRLRPSNLAGIRHLRLDWNTRCQGNSPVCFYIETVPNAHSCHNMDSGWSAPLYMVACYLTLTTQEPWVKLSVGFHDNALSNMIAKPLYEKMTEILVPTLAGPLPAGQRRKQLTSTYLVRLVEVWQHVASRLLAENCIKLQNQGLAAIGNTANVGHNGGNHALQYYQMQLMLLEQQNKMRLIMARQVYDVWADFHPLSSSGSCDEPEQQGSRPVLTSLVTKDWALAGKGTGEDVRPKATARSKGKRSRAVR
ncbi:hypothetical protein B0A55_03662 [Friedmanniomyces simplex]|uniref:F-box domain-containing protein n=1 Tax=Friedmanniomyces simplex TaxID=329884 RepID=A0A4V5NHP4_9PEZI|nr:hypothetical protein B0A55_03662 [Friedmanniomyces simplex]